MAAAAVAILLAAGIFGIARLPSGEARVGALGVLAGTASGTPGVGRNTGSGSMNLPFTIASLSASFGILAEFPETASGTMIPVVQASATASPAVTPVANASRTASSVGVATGTSVAIAGSGSVPLTASPTLVASVAVKPLKPVKATETAKLEPPKAKLPDLEALGYRLHGIIHRKRGRSSVFIYDPGRGKEVVVTAGASDPIRLLEVSDRRVVILTPKGKGTLRLGDAGPPTSRSGSFAGQAAQAASGVASSSGLAGNASPAFSFLSASGTFAVGTIASAGLTTPVSTTVPVAATASAELRPFAGVDSLQLMKAGALEAKREQGRWYAVVGKVASDSPLAKAGFREGDKIETVGQSGFAHGAQIPMLLERWGGTGHDSKITVIRNGASIQWKAGEQPPEAGLTGIPRVTPSSGPPKTPPLPEPVKPFGTVPPPATAPVLPPGVIAPFGGGKPAVRPELPKPATGYGHQSVR